VNPDLLTEKQNSTSASIDTLPTAEMLQVINEADQEVAPKVGREIPQIAAAVDAIVARLQDRGRLFYIGAGTSGRLGVLDASECPPTYHTPPELVQGVIAGGEYALTHSIERAEDDPGQGERDLLNRGFNSSDALVGIAASGRTPYVIGGLTFARSQGALTVGLSCVREPEFGALCDILVSPLVGPEVITGSTRMRAGTATKLILNMISTGVMIRLGYVYGNLMVNVQPTNSKLLDRSRRIVATIADVSYEQASQLLSDSGSVRAAIVMHKRKVDRTEAEALLASSGGKLREALQR
jgi:N-acetylmuramic acid 6-phosphate etherase